MATVVIVDDFVVAVVSAHFVFVTRLVVPDHIISSCSLSMFGKC